MPSNEYPVIVRSKLATQLVNSDESSTEPARNVGITVTSVAGILSLITVLFPNLLSDRVQVLIYVIASFALPLITAFLIRGKVWSPASVVEVVDEAVDGALEAAKKPKNVNPPNAPKLL